MRAGDSSEISLVKVASFISKKADQLHDFADSIGRVDSAPSVELGTVFSSFSDIDTGLAMRILQRNVCTVLNEKYKLDDGLPKMRLCLARMCAVCAFQVSCPHRVVHAASACCSNK